MPRWELFYHVITATRNREPLIDQQVEEVIRASLHTSAQDGGFIVHAFGAMPDHIHVVVSNPPSIAVSKTVQSIKGGATFRINKALPAQKFSWQSEYGVLSFAARDLDAVSRYVLNQKSHHASGNLNTALEADQPD